MKKITQQEFNEKIGLHRLWLDDSLSGEKLILFDVDFTDCDMQGCDMQGCDMRGCNMQGCDMRGCNMQGCDMQGCDMRGCDIDFSVWGLSCKTLSTKIDNRLIIQLLYHAAMPTQNNKIEDLAPDIIELFDSCQFKSVVNKFHRTEECGEFKGVNK